jgi:hypothetical protein
VTPLQIAQLAGALLDIVIKLHQMGVKPTDVLAAEHEDDVRDAIAANTPAGWRPSLT